MKKLVIIALLLSALSISASAQRWMTRTGKVRFSSSTSIENIEAVNNEVAGALNSIAGEVVFIVPIKSFKFDKALMQEHFNENYLESDKYPKAFYQGKIADMSKVNFSKDGTYSVLSKGQMTIHGITKYVNIPATIVIKGGTVTVHSEFNIKPADYGIKIPSIVASKIAADIAVTVDSILKEMDQ